MNPSIKLTLSDRGNITQTNSTFKWTIENFPDYCRSSGERMLSPIFSTGNNGEYKWRLELYPYNYQCTDSDYLSLYVLSENHFPITASYEISIYNERTATYYHKRTTSKQKFNVNESWGFHKYIARNDLLPKLETSTIKTLTILLDLFSVYLSDGELPENDRIITLSAAYQRKILQNYEQLFIDQRLWDVKVLVNGADKQLYAHKAILSAGSEAFSSMFQHDMQEKRDNSVDIKDVDYDTLKEMLRFIYSGKVEEIDKLAMTLYVAADKYRIEELMTMCMDYLCQNLDINNAVSYLSFAYLQGIELLKNKAKRYIVQNAKDFIDQPDFRSLNNSKTQIIFELFEELVTHKS